MLTKAHCGACHGTAYVMHGLKYAVASMLWQTYCTICRAGSRPAVGYTPAGMQQIVGANVSIPFMPGMSMGAMHIGPNGPRPTMAGPAPAPANGPAPATAGSGGGAPGTTGMGAAGGGGPAPGAGVGQAANRAGHPAGLNFGALLQSALAGAGGQPGQPNRPGQSVLLGHDLSGSCSAFPVACKRMALVWCLPPWPHSVALSSCLLSYSHLVENYTCQDPVSSSNSDSLNVGCSPHFDLASHSFKMMLASLQFHSCCGRATMRCSVL